MDKCGTPWFRSGCGMIEADGQIRRPDQKTESEDRIRNSYQKKFCNVTGRFHFPF